MKRKKIVIKGLMCVLLVLTSDPLTPFSGQTSAAEKKSGLAPRVVEAVKHDLSPPLRSLRPALSKSVEATETVTVIERRSRLDGLDLVMSAGEEKDAVVQSWPGILSMPTPTVNFEGVSNVNGVLPPDPNGDVGLNHYVQWVNLSLAVYDKAGNLLLGPIPGNQLWQGFGGPCETYNHGDPIVLYDHLADRWLASQFAIPGGSFGYHQCIAVSQTGDPTGSWYRYDFRWSTTKMNDYPKFGVWPDGYYLTVNQFRQTTPNKYEWAGAGVAVFERSKTLLGQSARMVVFDLESVNSYYGGILPADLDGAPPPLGTPNYFVEMDDDAWGYSGDRLALWEFRVDWDHPENSTFGAAGHPNLSLPTAPFDSNMCGYSRNCIPQPGGVPVDAISDRLMYRLQYRWFGTHASMVVNHTVDAGGDHAAIRWYELVNDGGGWAIRQQGTYAPDAHHRWMGSIAMDGAGNIALGYSLASTSLFPSIAAAGRLSSDPLNTLPQTERVILSGGGYQEHPSGRWGDYSSMSVDPADDCTFWYTQEYYASSSLSQWRTRIAAFRFPDCITGPRGHLAGRVTDAATGDPLASVRVVADSRGTFSNSRGEYALRNLTPGSYEVTASRFGYESQRVSGVMIADGATTIKNFSLVPRPRTQVEITVRDAAHHFPLYARVLITHADDLETTIFTDPETGRGEVELVQGETIHFRVSAILPGFVEVEKDLIFTASSSSVVFELEPDVFTDPCAAGYQRVNTAVYREDFTTSGGYTVVNYNLAVSPSWKWGQVLSGPYRAHSGLRAWATNLTGDYQNREKSCLVSPRLDLSAQAGQILRLSWWQWLSTEEYYDQVWVDVTSNGGATWERVYGPLSGPVNLSWTQQQIFLEPTYASANFQVRFCLSSDPTITRPGYYVDDVAVELTSCQPLAGGMVVGKVTDANTGTGLGGVTISDDLGRTTLSLFTPDDPAVDDGGYALFTSPGSRQLRAFGLRGYGQVTKNVNVTANSLIFQDLPLPAGLLSADQSVVEIYASPTFPVARALLLLSNVGGAAASFRLWEINSPYHPNLPTGPFAVPTRHLGPKNMDRMTLGGIAYYQELPAAEPLAAGEVIQEWSPTSAFAWGVGIDTATSFVWVSDYYNPLARLGTERDYKYYPDGRSTGAFIDISSWVESFGADLAYNPLTRMLWQVNVGGDNCIYELDPARHRSTGRKLCPPFGTSQRGLAYDPHSDTFYSGSWNDGIIYHFDSSGVLLDSKDVSLPIAGLAYNPISRHLFVAANSYGQDIYVLDTAHDYKILGAFSIPGLDDFNQAGLELDCAGRLWIVDMNNPYAASTATVIQADSGEESSCTFDIPWLTLTPPSAAVEPDLSLLVRLTANADGLPLGNYPAQLRLYDDTPYGPLFLPVTLHVVSNLPPVVSAGEDQWVPPASQVQLSSAGSFDLDGSIVAWEWEQTSGPAVVLDSATSPAPSFLAPAVEGVVVFRLTAADDGGAEGSDEVKITVSWNRSPVAEAGEDREVVGGQKVELDGNDSYDPEGSPLRFRWLQLDGVYVPLTGAGSAAPSFTAPRTPAVLLFQLTVEDELHALDSDTVVVTVHPAPAGGGGGGDDGGGCGCVLAAETRSVPAAAAFYALPFALTLALHLFRFVQKRGRRAQDLTSALGGDVI